MTGLELPSVLSHSFVLGLEPSTVLVGGCEGRPNFKRRILFLRIRVRRRRVKRGSVELRIHKGEAFEIVKGTLELLKDIFREVTVASGVVLQVERIKNNEVGVLQTVQLIERPECYKLNYLILPIIEDVYP